MVQVPAIWVLAGFGTAALVVWVFVRELGAILGLDKAILDISPFARVPKLPGPAFTAMPLVWLTVVAALASSAGLGACHRRRGSGVPPLWRT